jgi:hypothetical protein
MTNLYHLLCWAAVPLAVIAVAMVLFAWRARVQP